MLPVSDHRTTNKKSAAVDDLNKSGSTSVLLGRKSSYKSLSSALSSYFSLKHRRLGLFLVVLCLQIIIFAVARSLPHGRRHSPSPITAVRITPNISVSPPSPLINGSDECRSGTVLIRKIEVQSSYTDCIT